jgi:UTP--glucose-1-phosphate uridylyltransferase
MAFRKITKVVIPVAGMGTRFLPVTKVIPKELFPIVNKPIIQLILEECIAGGIETVVFVTARPKILIEDYFDPHDLTSFKLEQVGKMDLIESVLELSKKIEIVSVRQYQPKGLGHAIYQARSVVAGQPFACVLGDDIMQSPSGSAIGDCIKEFEKMERGSVIGTIQVPPEDTQMYGIVATQGDNTKNDFLPITKFVEKPIPSLAPSNWAMPGRYVFDEKITDFLKNLSPGKNGELQLTDGMQNMLEAGHSFFAKKIAGRRFDTGDKLGYIIANIEMGLEDPVIKDKFQAWIHQRFQK